MPQRQKTVTVDGRDITIMEMDINEIVSLLSGGREIIRMPFDQTYGELMALWPMAMDISIEDFRKLKLYGDDVTLLMETFKEVNPGFFEVARTFGVESLLAEIPRIFMGSCCARLLSLASGGTAE
jgi:hypothetical protein